MTLTRLVRLLALGMSLAALAAPDPLPAAGGAGWVRGVVRDPAGRRIEGAGVRVDSVAGPRAILTATTNGGGEFFLAGLAPGLYLLTAHKEGYASASSRLNTLVESSIALTLPPLLGEMRHGGVDEASLPRDRSWALRQPRRDVLREQGADPATSAAQDGAPPGTALPEPQPRSREAEAPRMVGDLQHLFALGREGDGGSRTSRIELGAAFDPDLELSLSGGSDRRTRAGGPSSGLPRSEDARRQARLGARFEPGEADTVEVSALLAERHYSLLADPAQAEDGFDQETRGYAARWARDLGGQGAMDVAFDFRSVDVEGSADEAEEDAGATHFADAENRVWQAAGSYRVEIGERREMEVDVRARRMLLEAPGEVAVSVLEETGGLPASGFERAWAVDLSGRERMALRGPLSLDYGFSYHRRAEELFSAGTADAFIPEAGLTVSPEHGPRWSAALSLALDRPEEVGPAPPPPAAEGEDGGLLSRVGYRLSMDYPFRRLGMNVAVNATYHPYAYSPLGEEGAPLDIRTPLRRSVMLSEGNAESLEVGLRLEKRFRKLVAALGSQLGQVEGYLVTGYFDEIPVQQVSYNLVRYMVASARGYAPGTGTLVHLDYQRFLNNPEQDFDPSSLSYLFERLDLALEQDLPFVDLWKARWRVLFSLQSLHTDALRGADLAALRAAGVRESERRLSGGLAIRF